MEARLVIALLFAILLLAVAIIFRLWQDASDDRKELKELKERIVVLHDTLPDSYDTSGYRYIGMRFQNEIKPYITVDRTRRRVNLTIIKDKEG